jgi:hypothetical protein
LNHWGVDARRLVTRWPLSGPYVSRHHSPIEKRLWAWQRSGVGAAVTWNRPCRTLARARARTRRVLADFGLGVWASTKNRSSLEASLGFAAITGTAAHLEKVRPARL